MNFFQALSLAYFSQPVENRAIYQSIRGQSPRTILEFGVQRGERTANLLKLAIRGTAASEISYICVDPFEGREISDGPGLSVRKMHKMLTQLGVKARLIPDSPVRATKQLASTLQNVDLLIVATPTLDWLENQRNSLAELLSDKGVVFVGSQKETGGALAFERFVKETFRTETVRELRRAG